ncbi:MAG: hypothetical protein WKF57_00050 [Nakamurella sp.]
MSAPAAVSVPERIDGTAPRGAWWAAFRLQRSSLLVGLGVLAVMAALVLWHRIAVLNLYADNGIIDPVACQAGNGRSVTISDECARVLGLQSDLAGPWQQLKTLWLVPSIIGAATGAALFSREFERRSQVFALTQSVGALRWFATKVTVGLVPLVAASIGVGFLFEWTANAYGVASWTPIEAPVFPDFGFVPGAMLLVSFAVGVAASTVLRQSLGALLVSVAAALGLLWCLVFGYQYLGPVERVTSSDLSESLYAPPPRAEFLGTGLLDRTGSEIQISYDCEAFENARGLSETDSVLDRCFASQGATQKFVDYLLLTGRAQLTWTLSGISAALSALFLAIGYALLRRRAS